MGVTYVCDKRKCEECYHRCHHTQDINHAVNFEKWDNDTFVEKTWIELDDKTADDLNDHVWYLIAHKDYETPMKAKYHIDVPSFTFNTSEGEQRTYLFENRITHYMPLPELP